MGKRSARKLLSYIISSEIDLGIGEGGSPPGICSSLSRSIVFCYNKMVFLIAVCKSFVVSGRRALGICKVSIRLLKRMDYVELRAYFDGRTNKACSKKD